MVCSSFTATRRAVSRDRKALSAGAPFQLSAPFSAKVINTGGAALVSPPAPRGGANGFGVSDEIGAEQEKQQQQKYHINERGQPHKRGGASGGQIHGLALCLGASAFGAHHDFGQRIFHHIAHPIDGIIEHGGED